MDQDDAKADTPGPTGLIIHNRNERHLLTRFVHAILKPLKPSLMKPGKLPPNPERLRATKRALKHCKVTENQIDATWVYDLTLKANTHGANTCKSVHPRRILYFAGGGWQMPPSEHHWAFCAELARRLDNTRVTIISCPLAPKSPVSVTFPQIERVYRNLMVESTQAGERVIVAGDSSGGNMALCLVTWALKSRDEEATKPPVAVFAMSPTTDLRHELEEVKKMDKFDPIHTHDSIRLTAKTWCPDRKGSESNGTLKPQTADQSGPRCVEWSFEDPRVSPIRADLSYLVRHGVSVHGLTGSYDVLAPEAVFFRDKCKEEGVTGEWLSWEGQMHCFPLTFRYGLKESKEGLDWIVSVLEKC